VKIGINKLPLDHFERRRRVDELELELELERDDAVLDELDARDKSEVADAAYELLRALDNGWSDDQLKSALDALRESLSAANYFVHPASPRLALVRGSR
jgi:hypothetical protein